MEEGEAVRVLRKAEEERRRVRRRSVPFERALRARCRTSSQTGGLRGACIGAPLALHKQVVGCTRRPSPMPLIATQRNCARVVDLSAPDPVVSIRPRALPADSGYPCPCSAAGSNPAGR